MKAYKETERKYYKYQYNDWVQPVLTANGTMGGNSFAVSAYYAWDGNASTYAQFFTNGVNETFFYNPKPLKISTMKFTYYSTAWITNGEIYGSNDGNSYTLLAEFSHSGNTGTVAVNNSTPYKYFKIKILGANGNNGYGYLIIADIIQIDVTAQEQTIIDGTESDHDFYKDIDTYKLPREVNIKNFKTIYEQEVAGEYEVTLEEGNYIVELYGAGGGFGWQSWSGLNSYATEGCAGGSGAGFKGLVHLPANTYTIAVGAGGGNGNPKGTDGGNTSLGNLIIATGGGGGSASTGGGTAGVGGQITVSDNLTVLDISKSQNGYTGTKGTAMNSWAAPPNLQGGLSVYNNTLTGYGAGSSNINGNIADAVGGYIKIMQQTTAEDSETSEIKYTYYGII